MQFNLELEKRVLERTMELESLNQELKALNLSKDKFLSVISHDLRNPLTSLLASSENLSRDAEKLHPDQVKMFSVIINRTSKKILNQLNELVEWAKSQREKTNFNPEKLDLRQRINESLELLKASASQKNIKLANNIPEGIFVNADALMLRSILQNLITNAIKFTPISGGDIIITAKASEDMIEVCIQDFGVGINLPSSGGTNQEIGNGLGLLLVKDFIVQHGGAIRVESEPDKGACFNFTIPAVR
jgi:signal transduction histidine kinase